LGRAQPRRHMGDPTHRPDLRIRTVHPHREGPDRLSAVTYPGGRPRNMKANKVALLLLAGALIAPTTAGAHISLHPNTIPAGAFATLDVRVPGEQEGAYVTKVDLLFPSGFPGVDYENVPGWTARVIEEKLATPIKSGGETINTDVSQIVWTWTGPLGKVN